MICSEYTCRFCEDEYEENDLVEVINVGMMCSTCFEREYDSMIGYQVFIQVDPKNYEEVAAYGGRTTNLQKAKDLAKVLPGGMVMKLTPIFRNPTDFTGGYEE